MAEPSRQSGLLIAFFQALGMLEAADCCSLKALVPTFTIRVTPRRDSLADPDLGKVERRPCHTHLSFQIGTCPLRGHRQASWPLDSPWCPGCTIRALSAFVFPSHSSAAGRNALRQRTCVPSPKLTSIVFLSKVSIGCQLFLIWRISVEVHSH